MIDNLDTLDKALLDRVNTTQCLSIRDVIRPFLLERSESVLRTRVRYLELHNLIKTANTRHGKIQCSPMEADHQTEARRREEEQTEADTARLSAWVDSEIAKGHQPTDDEIVAEISRFVSEETDWHKEEEAVWKHNDEGYEAQVRARKGL